VEFWFFSVKAMCYTLSLTDFKGTLSSSFPFKSVLHLEFDFDKDKSKGKKSQPKSSRIDCDLYKSHPVLPVASPTSVDLTVWKSKTL